MRDVGIVAVAAGCPELRRIDLSNTTQMTESAIIALAEGCPKVTKFFASACRGITDRSLCAIGQQWLLLITLNMCNGVMTSEGIDAIEKGCPLLTTCHLPGCMLLTMLQ